MVALASGCFIAGNCAVLHAQTDQEPGVIISGPFSLEPLLTTEVAYDDNIFNADTDEVDSWIMRIKPSLNTVMEAGGQVYSLSYGGDYGFFTESSDDDYDDHDFSAGADLTLGYRSHVNLGAAYLLGHEARGTILTEGFDPANPFIDEAPETGTTRYNIEYAYGSTASNGRIVLAAGYRELKYRNFRDQTRFRDRDYTWAGATFYYRVLPVAALLFEIRGGETTYRVNRPDTAGLDSKTTHYLTGAAWEITELTSGTVKLGYIEREYDDDARGNFSGFDWEATIRWSPLSYSHIDFFTSRVPREAYGIADFIDTKRYGLTWTHDWTDLVETRLEATYLDENFKGENRQEETYEYGMAINYKWRRWLSFELGADFSDRDSNIETLEYQGALYRLSANWSL